MLFFLCVFLVYNLATVESSKAKSVNLNLETVLEFDNKNLATDVQIIDNVQKFLSKVRKVLDNKKDFRRTSFDKRHLKFTEFLENAIIILRSFKDNELEHLIYLIDDELRKYHYKGCKFYELVQSGMVRKSVSNALDTMRITPLSEVRRYLEKLLKKLQDRTFTVYEMNVIDYVNSLYQSDSTGKMYTVLKSMEQYRTKSKRSSLDLLKIVRNGIRSIIFDHYSGLTANARKDLKIKLATYIVEYNSDDDKIEMDTENYMEYKIMQGKEKITLRLKKGMLPHKFQCQKDCASQPPPLKKVFLKRKQLETTESSLSGPSAKQSVGVIDSTSETDFETGSSLSLSHVYTEIKNPCEASTSTSLLNVCSEKQTHFEKAIQVNSKECCSKSNLLSVHEMQTKAIQVNCKINYRSKSVNVNLCPKTKTTAVSPFHNTAKTTSTSPLKITESPLNTDVAIISSSQPSLLSSSSTFEPGTSSHDSSWLIEDDSDNETQFKIQMRRCMLTAIEKEPKMMLGLPKKSFHLIKLLSENISLPTIDILITLKKIKLNESFSILALQFGYTQSTISRIFSKTVPLLAEKLKSLIVWPTPVEIFNKLPIAFRARYSNVVSIIDCLEIEIEKPSNAVHQSLTWSQYKKCNTLKYLVSCTPDGLVNFVSDGYGGRVTDVMIVEDCGFLECLPPNTAVMADRGFKDLSRLIGEKNCTLIRPPSVYKSTPISKEDVKQSKRIAALRIHVERVINRLREFHMLLPHACVDHNLIPVMDDVVIVAFGLINMQDVLIKK